MSVKSVILKAFYNLPINIQRSLTKNKWRKKQQKSIRQIDDNIKAFDEYATSDRKTLETNQIARFRELLSYAIAHVPYYREHYRNINVDEFKTFEDLSRIPIIDKKTVIEHLDEFLSDEYIKDDLARHSTGGSTGIPLDLYNTKTEAANGRKTLFLWDYMGGVYGKRLKGAFIGTAYKDLTNNKLLWGVSGEKYKGSFGINDDYFYMTSMNMTENILCEYEKRLLQYKPDFIKGYASGVVNLARHMKKRGLTYKATAVLTSSDLLSKEDRELCEEVFGCKIFNHYGQTEDVAAASECIEEHGFHVDMVNCLVETVDKNNDQVFEEMGEIVGTNLNNYVMPLIRYRMGDFGILSKDLCPCGNQSWLLKGLIGRVGDRLKCTNGKEFNQVDIVELIANLESEEREAFDSLLQYQIIQDTPTHINLVVQTISGDSLTTTQESIIINALLRIISDPGMKCNLKYKAVLGDHNGKIRKIINECKN